MSAATQIPPAGTYAVDPYHSTVAFAIRHNGIATYRNRFDEVSGSLVSDGEQPTIEGVAMAASIAIRHPLFRGQMLGKSWFDAERHPQIAFRSSALRIDGDRAELEGDLTLRGTTRPIVAIGTWSGPVVGQWGRTVVALALETTIDRTDFGMVENLDLPGGRKLLGDDVTIAADIQLIKED